MAETKVRTNDELVGDLIRCTARLVLHRAGLVLGLQERCKLENEVLERMVPADVTALREELANCRQELEAVKASAEYCAKLATRASEITGVAV